MSFWNILKPKVDFLIIGSENVKITNPNIQSIFFSDILAHRFKKTYRNFSLLFIVARVNTFAKAWESAPIPNMVFVVTGILGTFLFLTPSAWVKTTFPSFTTDTASPGLTIERQFMKALLMVVLMYISKILFWHMHWVKKMAKTRKNLRAAMTGDIAEMFSSRISLELLIYTWVFNIFYDYASLQNLTVGKFDR